MQPQRPIRLCIVVTVGKSLHVLYRDRLEHLQRSGFEVTTVCAPSALDEQIRARGVRLFTVPMARAVTPWSDVRTIWRLWRFFRREKFDLIEVSTPKAAMVGAIAARLAGVHRLVHVVRGLPYETQTDLAGRLMRWSAAAPCWLADAVYAVSHSVRQRLDEDRVCRADRVRVLGRGSYSGVDVARFSPEQIDQGGPVRERLGIPPHATVLGFMGRLTRDKGAVELVQAFREIRAQRPGVWLLMLGGVDVRDRPPDDVVTFLERAPHVLRLDRQEDVVPFLAAMDIFALPTYREGLANVLLEAAAMGLPVVCTTATGSIDASVDGVTGIQVPVGDAAALRDALLRLIDDPLLRARMGAAGRAWVAESFERKRVWQRYDEEYRRLVYDSSEARGACRSAGGRGSSRRLAETGCARDRVGPAP